MPVRKCAAWQVSVSLVVVTPLYRISLVLARAALSSNGALYDPYAFKWHGSGQFISTSPAPEASYRAFEWALMSTFDSQPALNVGLILYDPSHGGIARLMNHRNAHLLCTFNKVALPLRQPDAWHNVRSHLHTNKTRLALVIV